MKEKDEVIVEEHSEQNKKQSAFLSNVWKKTVDISKKTAESVQQKTKEMVEKGKEKKIEKKMKKLNPLFPETFQSANFHLPNIIEIVDDAKRRGIELCEGAIGWLDVIKDVEVLHLYDEWVEQSGIQFVPFWKCDNIYCVDNFNRNRYVNANFIFRKSTEDKLAELENIAYCLGAKFCSVEIVESDKELETLRAKSKLKSKQLSSNSDFEKTSSVISSQKGKTVSNFNGHSNPRRPDLKWFAYDDNINGLIEKRCNDIYSIESKILELSGASSVTMNKKVASAIDSLLNIKAICQCNNKR